MCALSPAFEMCHIHLFRKEFLTNRMNVHYFVSVSDVIRYIKARIDLLEFASWYPGVALRQFNPSRKSRQKVRPSSFLVSGLPAMDLVLMVTATQSPGRAAGASLAARFGVTSRHPIPCCSAQLW